MEKEKALHIMKSAKKMCELFGDNIPKNELNLLEKIIYKLESKIDFEYFTKEEMTYLEKSYKSIYEPLSTEIESFKG